MYKNTENFTKTIDRLKYYLDNRDYNFNQLAVGIGISNSYFSKMYKNKGSLGEEIINKILLFYENLNPDWLLTGRGEMLRNSPNSSEIDIKSVGYLHEYIDVLKKENEQLKKKLHENLEDVKTVKVS